MKSISYIILFTFISLPIFLSCEKKEELEPISPIVPNDTIKKDSTVKQDSIAFLKSTKSEYGIFTFTYDAQNHVIKMSEFDASGKFISDPYEFNYSGDKLVTSIDKLNGDKEYTYTYTGNLISKVTLNTNFEKQFTYDVNENLTLCLVLYHGKIVDSVVYEGYINNRPSKAIEYRFSEDTLDNIVQWRYTYDADNNLAKVEFLNTKYYTTWRLDNEYFYDLKIPNITPKMPFGNVHGIEGGIYGNPNPNSKDVNTHLANKEIRYVSCLDIDKYSGISITTSIKKDAKGLPLEMEGQSESYDKCSGVVDKTTNGKSEFEYIYIKK